MVYRFAIILALGLSSTYGQFLVNPYIFAASSNYIPYTATFDGSNDSATRTFTAGISGFADAKTVTISVLCKMGGGDGSSQFLIWRGTSGGQTRLLLERTSSNAFRLLARTSGNADVANITSSVTKVAADGWFHLLWWLDAGALTNKLYINGVEDTSLTISALSDAVIDLTGSGSDVFRVGAGNGLAAKFNGTVSDTLIYNVVVTDPTKFWSGGAPVDVGTDGSIPIGIPPSFYFGHDSGAWENDTSGNGNTLTVTGALSYGSYP